MMSPVGCPAAGAFTPSNARYKSAGCPLAGTPDHSGRVSALAGGGASAGGLAGSARLGSVMTNRVWPGRLVTPT
jgi:hypothetical protein